MAGLPFLRPWYDNASLGLVANENHNQRPATAAAGGEVRVR